MAENEFAPVTPGEMLKEEFLAAYGLSQSQLAKAIGISPNQIAEIINNRRRITADTALRLSSPLSFRDAAKRRARNPENRGNPDVTRDSGFAPSARPGMTAVGDAREGAGGGVPE